ncbi:MAG: hypothetical protein WBH20_13490 [Oceanisphaera sp.]|uniref:hypothetical protein n=1 Tax=Oceanisphaera sp. TaxID=1929979 RepID=UPI003C77AE63
MKAIKYVMLVILVGLLSACDHGFEGEYKTKAGSGNEMLNAFSELMGSHSIIIGSDYIESEGERTTFEEIFVRKSDNGQRYLVFKESQGEQAWKIIDDNTLQQGNDLINITLQKIK